MLRMAASASGTRDCIKGKSGYFRSCTCTDCTLAEEKAMLTWRTREEHDLKECSSCRIFANICEKRDQKPDPAPLEWYDRVFDDRLRRAYACPFDRRCIALAAEALIHFKCLPAILAFDRYEMRSGTSTALWEGELACVANPGIDTRAYGQLEMTNFQEDMYTKTTIRILRENTTAIRETFDGRVI